MRFYLPHCLLEDLVTGQDMQLKMFWKSDKDRVVLHLSNAAETLKSNVVGRQMAVCSSC